MYVCTHMCFHVYILVSNKLTGQCVYFQLHQSASKNTDNEMAIQSCLEQDEQGKDRSFTSNNGIILIDE